jgi:hypothetical protein
MSGTIGDNVYRASGVIASAAGGGLDWQSVTTGSTLTAVAGNGYPIDTTSNICTITLPASASVGDEIIFTDYAGTWGTYAIFFDPNGLNYQSRDDTFTIEYSTDNQVLHIVYIDATEGWMPILDKTVTTGVPTKGNQEGVFGYGEVPGDRSAVTNLVSNTGVVAADVSGLGTARQQPGACEYDGDKGIFGFGQTSASKVSITNLVSNVGVVAADQAATTGTARNAPGALEFGGDKGIFAFGSASVTAVSNLVSNAGVVASDVTGVGTARRAVGACEYGDDKGIMAFGYSGSNTNISNLISNVGVVATDQAATTGLAREYVSACGYDYDKGIFSFGGGGAGATNLISNAGVVASDVTQVGSGRHGASSCEYGGSKGIFCLGYTNDPAGYNALSNLVSDQGVVADDTASVAGVTTRYVAGACSFG